MAVFFPAGIPPLTAAEQSNKARYLAVFQGHSPEELLRDPLLLPFPTPQFSDYPHDPQGPEESLRQREAKRLNVQPNLHEGEVLLIAPGTPHAFLDDSDDCLIYNLLFPLERFEMAFQPVLRSHSELSTFLLKTLYTGIRSVSQYFTAFRARYGMSPAEYRQTYRRR